MLSLCPSLSRLCNLHGVIIDPPSICMQGGNKQSDSRLQSESPCLRGMCLLPPNVTDLQSQHALENSSAKHTSSKLHFFLPGVVFLFVLENSAVGFHQDLSNKLYQNLQKQNIWPLMHNYVFTNVESGSSSLWLRQMVKTNKMF